MLLEPTGFRIPVSVIRFTCIRISFPACLMKALFNLHSVVCVWYFACSNLVMRRSFVFVNVPLRAVSYTHLTLPTIYSV